ncbi:hypothetical protein PR048_027354 [Dryococelus australis]|uniref:Uncharacterized protein n=1 Tax=Dryococelus australis TaxID=614101 RepID=A0ABQ9GF87_9NEOP|nr:hypothetical protein PR048_027354 [Dryococelus australis]
MFREKLALPPRRTGFNPRPVHSGLSQVGIPPDDVARRWVFSAMSRFPAPCILALLHTHLPSRPDAKSRPTSPLLLEIAIISSAVFMRPPVCSVAVVQSALCNTALVQSAVCGAASCLQFRCHAVPPQCVTTLFVFSTEHLICCLQCSSSVVNCLQCSSLAVSSLQCSCREVCCLQCSCRVVNCLQCSSLAVSSLQCSCRAVCCLQCSYRVVNCLQCSSLAVSSLQCSCRAVCCLQCSSSVVRYLQFSKIPGGTCAGLSNLPSSSCKRSKSSEAQCGSLSGLPANRSKHNHSEKGSLLNRNPIARRDNEPASPPKCFPRPSTLLICPLPATSLKKFQDSPLRYLQQHFIDGRMSSNLNRFVFKTINFMLLMTLPSSHCPLSCLRRRLLAYTTTAILDSPATILPHMSTRVQHIPRLLGALPTPPAILGCIRIRLKYECYHRHLPSSFPMSAARSAGIAYSRYSVQVSQKILEVCGFLPANLGSPVGHLDHWTLHNISKHVQSTYEPRDKDPCGVAVGMLASHQGELDSIPGRVKYKFSYVGFVPDDAAGRRVFSGVSRFPRPCIPALLHYHRISHSSAPKTSIGKRTHRFRALRIAATEHLMKVIMSPLSHPRCRGAKASSDKRAPEANFAKILPHMPFFNTLRLYQKFSSPYWRRIFVRRNFLTQLANQNEVTSILYVCAPKTRSREIIQSRDCVCAPRSLGQAVMLLSSQLGEPGLTPCRVTPDFRTWESWLTMQLLSRFSRDLPFLPPLHSGTAPLSLHLALIGSQDLVAAALEEARCFQFLPLPLRIPCTYLGAPPQPFAPQGLLFSGFSGGGWEEHEEKRTGMLPPLLLCEERLAQEWSKYHDNLLCAARPSRATTLRRRRASTRRLSYLGRLDDDKHPPTPQVATSPAQHVTVSPEGAELEPTTHQSGADSALPSGYPRMAQTRVYTVRALAASLQQHRMFSIYGGRGDVLARLLASHQGEPGSIPGAASLPDIPHLGIVPDDGAGGWVFSGISRFLTHLHSGSAPYSPHFTLIGSRDPDVKEPPESLHSTPLHSAVHVGSGARTHTYIPRHGRARCCTGKLQTVAKRFVKSCACKLLRVTTLWEHALFLIGYCVLRKVLCWLDCRLASKLPGADWRTPFLHVDGK